jgi:ankyrin repeat protein
MFSSNSSLDADDADATTRLYSAIRNGDLKVVQRLCTCYGSIIVNVKNNAGWTALHWASIAGHLPIFQYLVETGEGIVDVENRDGDTPLHFACFHGRLQVVQYMVTMAGAYIHAVNAKGNTPLHLASKHGCTLVVRYLVEMCNADVNAMNINGDTPLLAAARSKSEWLETIQCLVEMADADVHVVDATTGNTPMHFACVNGHLATVQYLIEVWGANNLAENDAGHTPLHIACENGQLALVVYLVRLLPVLQFRTQVTINSNRWLVCTHTYKLN